MPKYTCEKCGKTMEDVQFYTYKNGKKTEMCKSCLTMHIDNFDPETFLWLLQKMDVPYVPQEWNVLRDRAYEKNPKKMNGMSVFGRYLSKMKLKQWAKYTWADSKQLQQQNQERQEQHEQMRKIEQEKARDQYEHGEISQAQYKTLVDTTYLRQQALEKEAAKKAEKEKAAIGEDNAFQEDNFIPEQDLPDPAKDLTQEDKIYLAMKWGRLYKPNEWVSMQRDYIKMQKAFGIEDPDTLNTLLLICKTNLRMNDYLDQGDIEGYQKLARVSDTLRKSANFTALQNKAGRNTSFSSIGELVEYAEKVGGQIPKYELDRPRDVVDAVIRDMKGYTKNLIDEDAALAREIEDYLKRREIAEQQERDRAEAKRLGLDFVPIKDRDLLDHKSFLEEAQDKDQSTEEGKESG